MDLTKIFWSRSRVKLLEKFVIEDVVSRSTNGFFIRELCRDLDEQINAVRRELMNLENIGLLKSYEENKKKYYMLNKNSIIYPEISEMFLKAYDIVTPIKNFFKGRKTLELVTISEAILDFRNENTNNIIYRAFKNRYSGIAGIYHFFDIFFYIVIDINGYNVLSRYHYLLGGMIGKVESIFDDLIIFFFYFSSCCTLFYQKLKFFGRVNLVFRCRIYLY